MEVEDEISCSCGCRQREEGCRADQQFKRSTCTCTCRDTGARTSCLEGGRSWDSSSCSCICPPSSSCTLPSVRDPSSCSCLPPNLFLDTEEVEEREERSEALPTLLLKWEYPVMLTLASLNLLLLSIIVVLARRHRVLRRRLRERPSHVGPLEKALYTPLPIHAAGGVTEQLLYTSDSDVSTELPPSESSDRQPSSTYRPSPQPSYSPPPAGPPCQPQYSPPNMYGPPTSYQHPYSHYSTLRGAGGEHLRGGGGEQPCCGYINSFSTLPHPSSLSSLPPPPDPSVLGTLGRETPL